MYIALIKTTSLSKLWLTRDSYFNSISALTALNNQQNENDFTGIIKEVQHLTDQYNIEIWIT